MSGLWLKLGAPCRAFVSEPMRKQPRELGGLKPGTRVMPWVQKRESGSRQIVTSFENSEVISDLDSEPFQWRAGYRL